LYSGKIKPSPDQFVLKYSYCIENVFDSIYTCMCLYFWEYYTGGVDPDQEMIDLRMNAVKHKILILSGKGGEIVIEIIWYNY